MSPAGTFARIAPVWLFRMFSATILPSRSLACRSLQWATSRPDVSPDPVTALAVTSFLSCRPLRLEMIPPTELSDDELRRISAPTTVLLGDREVIYAGGPQAAPARAQWVIPNVRARLLLGAGMC